MAQFRAENAVVIARKDVVGLFTEKTVNSADSTYFEGYRGRGGAVVYAAEDGERIACGGVRESRLTSNSPHNFYVEISER